MASPVQEPACGRAEISVISVGSLSVSTTLVAPALPRFATATVKVTAPPTVAFVGWTTWLTAALGAGSACHDGTASLVGANATRVAAWPLAFASQTSLPRRNAIWLPSGEYAGAWSPTLAGTNCAWPRPVAVIAQIESAPVRFETNAIVAPSDDQVACRSFPGSRVSRRSPAPSAVTVTMSLPP